MGFNSAFKGLKIIKNPGNGRLNNLNDPVLNVLTYPHKKKSRGVISGDRGGQAVRPSLPIHLFGNDASKNRQTCEPQCGGAPSCWKIIHIILKKKSLYST